MSKQLSKAPKRRASKTRKRRASNNQIAVAIIGGLATIIVAIIYVIPQLETKIGLPSTPSITLDSHRNGDRVPHEVDIKGEFEDIPQNAEIWIYVYATDIRKYYTDRVVTYGDKSGTWEAIKVIVGEKQEKDTAYEIGVLLVEGEAIEALRSNPDGRDTLPSGTEKFSKITVIRE